MSGSESTCTRDWLIIPPETCTKAYHSSAHHPRWKAWQGSLSHPGHVQLVQQSLLVARAKPLVGSPRHVQSVLIVRARTLSWESEGQDGHLRIERHFAEEKEAETQEKREGHSDGELEW